MTTTPSSDDDLKLRQALRDTFSDSPLTPFDQFRPGGAPDSAPRRAGTLSPPVDEVGLLTLVRGQDGVLRWITDAPTVSPVGGRAGLFGGGGGAPVDQFTFRHIAPNQVGAVLNGLDARLTPNGRAPATTGGPDLRLRRWDGAQLVPFRGADAAGKKVLLFVHGTFSNCDNFIKELREAPGSAGTELLAAATNRYDLVLTFDHPTVACSPAMNAFDLASLLHPAPASLDIISHSRGGLVVRWFLEGFLDPALRPKARAILVGATIAGTSLAAPPRQKAAMQYLTNIGDALRRLLGLGAANPFLAAAGTLTMVLTSLTRFAAKTPALDMAVAMIPGLQGQSRVGNNPELLRLRENRRDFGIEYFAIKADFQPKDPGWNFLQYFSRPMQRLANFGADMIFDGPNDLVVDVASMTDLADAVEIPGDSAHLHDFGTTDHVHHLNYFRQVPTLTFIRSAFGF